MLTPFFITGLPRSRTAWLANLFTQGGTLCFHEPILRPGQLIESNPGYRVGISSSDLASSFPALRALYPEAPWVFIERTERDAVSSLIKFLKPRLRCSRDIVEKVIAANRANWGELLQVALVVPFADLGREDVIRKVWNQLTPERPFCVRRWQILEGFNVQQDLTRALLAREGQL
jgi:hypothetical protein